ncbi:unnamed protein product [marine sediment metagenome]|uniref:Glycosyl transferase family 25 domain-containing protein n=1 Tax=marine sediment metagenome TaxID=412755 RepID=X0SWV2_9ZZZZ
MDIPIQDLTTFRIPRFSINDIDMIYYINLDDRVMRKKHLLSQLNRLKIPKEKITRISATYMPFNPQVGCAASHIEALTRAYRLEHETILILEDDFEFTIDLTQLNQVIDDIYYANPSWKVLQLSAVHQTTSPVQKTVNKNNESTIHFERVIKADTTAAYLIKRDVIPLLIPYFKQCIQLQNRRYPIDVLWNTLQPRISWYITTPHIGKQCEAFPSDIDSYRTSGYQIASLQ